VGHECLVKALADEETDWVFLILHYLHLDLIIETHLVVMHVRVHERAQILAESGLLSYQSFLVALLSVFLVNKVLLLTRENVQLHFLGGEVLADLRGHPQILHHLRQDRLGVHVEFFLQLDEVSMNSLHQTLRKGNEVVHPFHVRCVTREEFFEVRDDLLGNRAQLVRTISWDLLGQLFLWLDADRCWSSIHTLENVKAASFAVLDTILLIRPRPDIPLASLGRTAICRRKRKTHAGVVVVLFV
jgi:hypothetical protein